MVRIAGWLSLELSSSDYKVCYPRLKGDRACCCLKTVPDQQSERDRLHLLENKHNFLSPVKTTGSENRGKKKKENIVPYICVLSLNDESNDFNQRLLRLRGYVMLC